MKPGDVTSSTYIDFGMENNDKDLKLKVSDHLRISKYKKKIAKGYIPDFQMRFLLLKKVKNTIPWTYAIKVPNGEKVVGTFTEKSYKRQIKQFIDKKSIKKKGDKLYVEQKDYDNSFNNWIDKKDIIIKMSFCQEPDSHSKHKTKIELDLSKYAIKSDLKEATGIDASEFAKNADLVSLKSYVDKSNIDELNTVLELRNVVDNDAVKKLYVINWLQKLMLLKISH